MSITLKRRWKKYHNHPCVGRFRYKDSDLKEMYSYFMKYGFENMKEKYSYEYGYNVFVRTVTRRNLRTPRSYRGAKPAIENKYHAEMVEVKNYFIKYGFDYIFEKYPKYKLVRKRTGYLRYDNLISKLKRHGFDLIELSTPLKWKQNHEKYLHMIDNDAIL